MVNKRFETPGDVFVRVENESGTVELATHDAPVTEVELLALDEASEELVESARVEVHASGEGCEVVVEVPRHSRGGAGTSLLRRLIGGTDGVAVTLRVPEGTRVEIATASAGVTAQGEYGAGSVRTASGEVAIEGVQGPLTVRTASGDVRLGSVQGECRVESASGDVRLQHGGGVTVISTASGDIQLGSVDEELRVKSASGDVAVSMLARAFRVQTASGDQRLDRVQAGRGELRSVSGDIVVGVARGTEVRLDAATVSGSLSSEIELDEDRVPPGGAGEGFGLELQVRTVSGDLRVERAGTILP